jgi:hypothetical protein
LDHNEGYPPVRLVFEGFREAVRIVEILRFIPLKNLVLKALMWGFAGAQVQKFKVAVERTESRLKRSDSEIPDFSKSVWACLIVCFRFEAEFKSLSVIYPPGE